MCCCFGSDSCRRIAPRVFMSIVTCSNVFLKFSWYRISHFTIVTIIVYTLFPPPFYHIEYSLRSVSPALQYTHTHKHTHKHTRPHKTSICLLSSAYTGEVICASQHVIDFAPAGSVAGSPARVNFRVANAPWFFPLTPLVSVLVHDSLATIWPGQSWSNSINRCRSFHLTRTCLFTCVPVSFFFSFFFFFAVFF